MAGACCQLLLLAPCTVMGPAAALAGMPPENAKRAKLLGVLSGADAAATGSVCLCKHEGEWQGATFVG